MKDEPYEDKGKMWPSVNQEEVLRDNKSADTLALSFPASDCGEQQLRELPQL